MAYKSIDELYDGEQSKINSQYDNGLSAIESQSALDAAKAKQDTLDIANKAYTTSKINQVGNNEALASMGLSGALYQAPTSGYSENSRVQQDIAMNNNIQSADRQGQQQLDALDAAKKAQIATLQANRDTNQSALDKNVFDYNATQQANALATEQANAKDSISAKQSADESYRTTLAGLTYASATNPSPMSVADAVNYLDSLGYTRPDNLKALPSVQYVAPTVTTPNTTDLPQINAVLGGSPYNIPVANAPHGTTINKNATSKNVTDNMPGDTPSKLAYLSDMMWAVNQKNAGAGGYGNVNISYDQIKQILKDEYNKGNISQQDINALGALNGWD